MYSSNVFFAIHLAIHTHFVYPLGGFLLCNEIKSFPTDTDDGVSSLLSIPFVYYSFEKLPAAHLGRKWEWNYAII